MTARPKAEMMAENRERRREAGLVRVEVHVPPAEKERLARYVRRYLGGECTVRAPRDAGSTRR